LLRIAMPPARCSGAFAMKPKFMSLQCPARPSAW
jgi:hypothetical protein